MSLTRRRLLGLGAASAGVAGVAACAGIDRVSTGGTGPGGAAPSAGSTSTAPAVATHGGWPVPYVPGRAMLGAYLDLAGMSPRRALDLRRRQLGRDERIVHVFYGWTDPLPRNIPYLPAGSVPMVSWRGTAYAGILNGSADALIARAGRNLRALGRPVMLRWGWEMNGNWYPWGGAANGRDPAGFVAAWRRIHRIFRDTGAGNVSWVWSVNWNDKPNESWNAYRHYYPGDAYVDWAGISGYNLHHETPGTLFDAFYATYAPAKPIMITEVGAVDRGGRTRADWITLFRRWVHANPAVGAVTWFDTDTHPGFQESWRIDSDVEALAAYRAMAHDPRFAA